MPSNPHATTATLRRFTYLRDSLHQDLNLDIERAPIAQPSVRRISKDMRVELSNIREHIAAGKDSDAIVTTCHLMDHVLDNDLNREIRQWHDKCIKIRLASFGNEAFDAVGPGSRWFENERHRISSKLYTLLGLLITEKKKRHVVLVGLTGGVGGLAGLKEDEDLGKQYYRAWVTRGRVPAKQLAGGGVEGRCEGR